MDRHPAAYLRRSYVDAQSPGDISLEAQRTAVRRLATADGHNGNVVEYNDWGVSADVAKASHRTEYARLLADMDAGRVTAVYAFDVDRLYRDPRDLIRLQDAAQAHGVRIVTTGGPLPIGEGADPAAEAFAFIGSVFNRMELQKIKKRIHAAQEVRRERGDVFGHPPYGWRNVRDATGRIVRERDESVDLEPIREAYERAGTVLGAVRLLNAAKVPAPKGGEWYTSPLTHVLDENWPGLLPKKGASGRRIRSRAILSQLVVCHCGHVMTPNTHRNQLYCSKGTTSRANHDRYTVQEKDLLPWVKDEAARLQTPDAVELADKSRADREAIGARIERVVDNYESGLISREVRDDKVAGLRGQLEALDAAATIIDVPALDWTWPPEKINAVLRAMWEHVDLDDTMRPVSATWRVPEWRS